MNKFTDDQIREARYRLWRMGNLEWKLDPAQKDICDFIAKSKGKISVLNLSRRSGKSFVLTIMAVQQCIQQPKSIVKFLQPEQKMIRVNIKPIMDKILEDCPPEMRPTFKTQDNIYTFPNKSEIQLAGTDGGQHEKLRGSDAHLCLIDEAAFVNDNLQYIVRSILLPSTMLTRGKIILSSTSPKSAEHDFARYMERAEKSNTLIRKTIFDMLEDHKKLANPRLTPEIVEEMIQEYPGGINDEDFRRECLCETVIDSTRSIIPEFSNDLQQELITEWPRPAFCSKYVAMDIGFKDLTVVLFGYYDFDNGVTVVEDEIVINGPQMTTEILAKLIREKETALWTDSLTGEFDAPHLRISDNNLIVINDLYRLHGLQFMPAQKDNKEMQLNQVRMELSELKIIINPRCKTLISHLKYGMWNKARSSFMRGADNGHADAIDALIYLIRHVDKSKNPYPRGYRLNQMGPKANVFLRSSYKKSENNTYDQLKKIFLPKNNK